VIEDRQIVDKASDSFDRVVQTKVYPLLTLARHLDPDRIKLVMLFSSVSGFMGNPGQADYAAANEALNRMARRLDDLWPGKVVSMNWGPWSGAGMVTPEVAEQLATRGMTTVPVEEGRRAVWQEIVHRGGGDVRVLVGSGSWIAEADRRKAAPPASAPDDLQVAGGVQR
jgi:NAD(P)-dependent dehydrogenase (short-subunit alcohol dehydrogenase family)